MINTGPLLNPTPVGDKKLVSGHPEEAIVPSPTGGGLGRGCFPDYIAQRLTMPFAWGSNDCICFAVGWLELSTGQDFLSQHKPWASEAEARRIVASLGGLEKQFDLHLARIEPNFARDGDIALIGNTAYLFSDAHVVSVGETGLVFRGRLEAECAFTSR